MIPKIIHYCWLSDDPIPTDVQYFINTWKNILPDYEIIKWDFTRFNKESSIWVSEAFDNKKYAFASDYIRVYSVYHYGGIYLDSDVEVLKSYNDLLELPAILGFENKKELFNVESASFGAEKHAPWLKTCLDYYEGRHFVREDGSFDIKVSPAIMRECIEKSGYNIVPVNNIEEAKGLSEKDIPVFPYIYFSPKSSITMKVEKSSQTYSIHQFKGTWLPLYMRIEKKISTLLGLKNRFVLYRIRLLIKKYLTI